MSILNITREELDSYKKTRAKLSLIYSDYVYKNNKVNGDIKNIHVFGSKMIVKSTYNFYPDGHDSRSINPQKIVQEVVIDLDDYIK